MNSLPSEEPVEMRGLDEFWLMGERDAFGHLGPARFPMEMAADPKRANEMLDQYASACESMLDEYRRYLSRLRGSTSDVETDEAARSIEYEYVYWWQLRRAFKLCRALWGAVDQSTAHYVESAGHCTRGTF